MKAYAYLVAVAVVTQASNSFVNGTNYYNQFRPQYTQQVPEQNNKKPTPQYNNNQQYESQNGQYFPQQESITFNQPSNIDQSSTPDLDRINNFDIDLLKSVSVKTTGNFMISPASIKAVLFMLAEGAVGDSQSQMLSVLGLNSIEEARDLWKTHYNKLRTPSASNGVTLENANALFLSKRYTINNEYNQNIVKKYDSEVTPVDFSNAVNTANSINAWISKKTHNYITELVDPGSFDAQAVMVVTNALYFKGIWKTKFSNVSRNFCFNVNGHCINTPMMEVETDLKYYYNQKLGFHAVELPYLNNRYAMLLMLPTDSIQTLTDHLNSRVLSETIKNLDLNEIDIYMPKFDIDYSDELSATLRNLGINKIFGKDANLNKIVNEISSPQVDNIIHKTRLEVNEEGSIAAAGSGAMVVPLMGSTSIRLVFDKPFMFFIRDVKNNAILFAGQLNDPIKKGTGSTHQRPNNANINQGYRLHNQRLPGSRSQ